jgi:plastocyanin
MTRIAPLSLALASFALLAAGCGSSNSSGGGGGESGGSSSSGPAPAGATVIKMQNIQFNPKQVNVKVGKPVSWENEDDVDHNVSTTGGVAQFESDNFGKGGTYTFTPKKAGEIKYTCTLHPGMDATLIVTG